VFDRSAAASYGSSGRYRVSGEDSALSDCWCCAAAAAAAATVRDDVRWS